MDLLYVSLTFSSTIEYFFDSDPSFDQQRRLKIWRFLAWVKFQVMRERFEPDQRTREPDSKSYKESLSNSPRVASRVVECVFRDFSKKFLL